MNQSTDNRPRIADLPVGQTGFTVHWIYWETSWQDKTGFLNGSYRYYSERQGDGQLEIEHTPDGYVIRNPIVLESPFNKKNPWHDVTEANLIPVRVAPGG